MPRLRYRKCCYFRVPDGWDDEMMERWFASNLLNFANLLKFPYEMAKDEILWIRFEHGGELRYLTLCIGPSVENTDGDPED